MRPDVSECAGDEVTCEECLVDFDEAFIERVSAFGVEFVCLDCALALTDAATFDEHFDTYGHGKCGCECCTRHRERVERERNRALAAATHAPVDAAEDISF